VSISAFRTPSFFKSYFLTPNSFHGIRHIHFVHILHFFGPSTTQNSESLENRRDELLSLISSGDGIRTTCGDDIRNTRTKKDRGLPIVNSD